MPSISLKSYLFALHSLFISINFIAILYIFHSPINFNIKMSRKYTQPQPQHQPWNWTDQRVQQIMKKYEQPNRLPRTPLATKHSNHQERNTNSPWKNHYYQAQPRSSKQEYRHNVTTDSIYPKETKTRARHEQKSYMQDQPSERRNEYKYKEYEPEVFNGDYSFNQQRHRKNEVLSREEEILDAKEFIERKEKKYLKTETAEKSSRRERQAYREISSGNKMSKQAKDAPWINQYNPKKASVNMEDYAPRISNIQRINNKIKMILESATKEEPNIITSKTREYTPNSKPSHQPLSIKQANDSAKIEPKSPLLLKRTDKEANKQPPKLQERSKSCLTLKKKLISTEPSKKIDNDVQRFNNKISQLQAAKRKLNISFKANQTEQYQAYEASAFTLEREEKVESLMETPVLCKVEESELPSHMDFEGETIETHSPFNALKESISRGESLVIDDHEEQMNQVAKGIEMRKKKLEKNPSQHEQPAKASQTKKFLQILSQQVQLDQRLQASKRLLAHSTFTVSELQDALSQRWRQMTSQQIQKEFHITLEEEDPFYSYREQQFELQDLVVNYIICNRHWSQKVEGKWDLKKLKEDGIFQRLQAGKGHILIEDLVREINISQGVFYRTRNLYLIFQRLTQPDNHLTLQKLYSILSRK